MAGRCELALNMRACLEREAPGRELCGRYDLASCLCEAAVLGCHNMSWCPQRSADACSALLTWMCHEASAIQIVHGLQHQLPAQS